MARVGAGVGWTAKQKQMWREERLDVFCFLGGGVSGRSLGFGSYQHLSVGERDAAASRKTGKRARDLFVQRERGTSATFALGKWTQIKRFLGFMRSRFFLFFSSSQLLSVFVGSCKTRRRLISLHIKTTRLLIGSDKRNQTNTKKINNKSFWTKLILNYERVHLKNKNSWELYENCSDDRQTQNCPF